MCSAANGESFGARSVLTQIAPCVFCVTLRKGKGFVYLQPNYIIHILKSLGKPRIYTDKESRRTDEATLGVAVALL